MYYLTMCVSISAMNLTRDLYSEWQKENHFWKESPNKVLFAVCGTRQTGGALLTLQQNSTF